MSALEHPRSHRRLQKVASTAPPTMVAALAALLESIAENPARASVVESVLELLTEALADGVFAETPRGPMTFAHLEALLNYALLSDHLAAVQQQDPLASAWMQGMRARQSLLEAEGGAVSAAKMADLLGMTRQGVDKRRRAGTLLAVKLGKRGFAYPVWQIGLDGLSDVLAVLQELDSWGQLLFLLSPNSFLAGVTPLDALRAGDTDRVIMAAREHGNQIAW